MTQQSGEIDEGPYGEGPAWPLRSEDRVRCIYQALNGM